VFENPPTLKVPLLGDEHFVESVFSFHCEEETPHLSSDVP